MEHRRFIQDREGCSSRERHFHGSLDQTILSKKEQDRLAGERAAANVNNGAPIFWKI
jgi:hypothetical protein